MPRVIILLTILLLTDPGIAQIEYREHWIAGGEYVPHNLRDIASMDVDMDGDNDIIWSNQLKTYWQDNRGTDFIHPQSFDPWGPHRLFIEDLNQDGLQDIVGANDNQGGASTGIFWWKNLGDGSYSRQMISHTAVRDLVVVDYDQDNDLDIISISNNGMCIFKHENNGSSVFTDDSLYIPSEELYSIDCGDRDGDGDIEILTSWRGLGFESNVVAWLERDNSGSFQTHLLDDDYNKHNAYWSHVAVSDLEGDGDIDIISSSVYGTRIYVNNGVGEFTKENVSSYHLGQIHPRDLEGDGDVDILGSNAGGTSIIVYLNNGNNTFTDASFSISNLAGTVSRTYPTDYDADGDVDIVAALGSDAKIVWFENDVQGNTFKPHVSTNTVNNLRSASPIDFDGDNDPDLVYISSSYNSSGMCWYENNGSSNFRAHQINTPADGLTSLFTVDLDEDGDVDLITGSERDQSVFWYQNNLGQITSLDTIANSAGDVRQVHAEDFDSDGDLDILSVSFQYYQQLIIHENLGFATFTPHVITTDIYGLHLSRTVDLDQDGNPDIVALLPNNNSIVLFKNLGAMRFERFLISNKSGSATAFDVADLDGDSDLDILTSSYWGKNIMWQENLGDLNFSGHKVVWWKDDVWGASAHDMDEDGDQDIIHVVNDSLLWIENEGSGEFSKRHLIHETTHRMWSQFDLDQDGDLDFLTFWEYSISWLERINPPDTSEYNAPPSNVELLNNFPNPFNPSTTIRYGIASDAHVTISILDIRGRNLGVIENDFKTEGWHDLHFDPRQNLSFPVSSGIYYVHMVSGTAVKTQKILYLK